MALTTSIILGLFVMVLFGSAKVIIKPAINRIGPYNSLFYEQIFVAFPLLAFSFFYADPYIPSKKILMLLIAAVIIGAIPIYAFFKAMSIGKVSLVTPIASSSSIITVFLSYTFYKESLSITQIFAVFLLIIGVLLVSFRYSKIRRLMSSGKLIPGAKFAFITMLGWGLYFAIIKPIVMEIGPVLSAAYLETGIFAIIAVFFFIGALKNRSMTKPGKARIYILFGGITTAIGSLLFNVSIEKAPVSLIYPIVNSSLLITSIASYIFLRERIELNQKIAILMILAGIVLISL